MAFLGDPGSYPGRTSEVEVIETHHAWVFLTDDHAYKMKKPSRIGGFDFSELDARRLLCDEEYRLNRRLAADTYLGVLPVVLGPDGQLQLGGPGRVVEWLVWMRRLPRERMLDAAASADGVGAADVHRLMRKLLRFYRRAPACPPVPGGYADSLARDAAFRGRELGRSDFGLPDSLVQAVAERQAAYSRAQRELLNARDEGGLRCEGHGDLRPEHVCLVPEGEPEIIDCLEFDRDLRCLDRVEEIAFLGMECRYLGQRWIETECIRWYRAQAEDPVPMHLWHFYGARRANLRAMLAAWHTVDGRDEDRWLSRAQDYLELAEAYMDQTGVA